MNSNEFISEVKNSEICPEDFDKVYPEFQKYQKLAMETLLELHRVCEANSIRYQLGFGSLLGAIRDEGQIPWDYDIDIIIPHEERYKLVDALNKDLDERFYFYSPETNKECRHYFMRVSPKGYRTDRLHVDVFYVIGAPENQEERYDFEKQMNKYFHLRFVKLVKIKEYAQNAYKAKIKAVLQKIKNINEPLEKVKDELVKICEKYDPNETGITIPVIIPVYKHVCWRTDELWDTELYSTPKGTFRVSKNYDSILKEIYGDYTRIFPLESRLKEMYKNYYLLSQNRSAERNMRVGRYYTK